MLVVSVAVVLVRSFTAQKMNFSFKDFFSKCVQIRSFLRIWSHLLKKSLMENFIFCAVFIKVRHDRSRRLQMFCNTDVLKNSSKVT